MREGAVALFGLSEFSVRLPAALAGVLAVYLTYLLVKHLFKRDSFALAAALLLAISPWHIAVGRYGVDVNWGVPLFLGGLLAFLKFKTHPRWLIVSGVLFALTFYTYFNYIVFTWLFLMSLGWIYRKDLWVRDRRTWLIGFYLIQLVFMLLYILQPNLTTRFSQATSVSQIGFVNRINEHRQACTAIYPKTLCTAIYNKYTDRVIEFSHNLINHYSTTIFFVSGSQLGLSGMPAGWGFLYPFEFVLIALGLIVMIRKQLFTPLLGAWFFLYAVPSSLAADGHIWRMFTFLPLPQIIGGIGLVHLANQRKQIWVQAGIGLICALFVFRFLVDYTSYLPWAQGANSFFGFRDLYSYLKTVEKDYDYIVVAPSGLGFDQLYIYYLFYMQPDPREYQLGVDVERPVGRENWVEVKRIAKWHFVGDVRNVVFDLPDKTLLVADGNFKEKAPLPQNVMLTELIKTINFANGDPAFKVLILHKNPAFKPQPSPKASL